MAFAFAYKNGSGGGGVADNIYTADGAITDTLRTVAINQELIFLLQTGGYLTIAGDAISWDELYFSTNIFNNFYAFVDIYAEDGTAYTQQSATDGTNSSNIYGSGGECFISIQSPGEKSEVKTLPDSIFQITVGNPDELVLKSGKDIGANGGKAGYWEYFPDFPSFNYADGEFGFYLDVYDDGGPIYTASIQSTNNYVYVSQHEVIASVFDGEFAGTVGLSNLGNTLTLVGSYNPGGVNYSIGNIFIQPQGFSNELRLTAYDSSDTQIGLGSIYINYVDISGFTYLIGSVEGDGLGNSNSFSFASDGTTVINGGNLGGDIAIVSYENIAINANDTISIQAVNNIDLGCDSLTFGLASTDLFQIQADTILFNGGSNFLKAGTGSPEGVVTGNVGSLYVRENGGAGTTLYVKESGSGNTGWTAK